MTIGIHRPELEALIVERMKRGGFQNVEDALLQALKTSPPVEEPPEHHAINVREPTSSQLCRLRPAGSWTSSRLAFA